MYIILLFFSTLSNEAFSSSGKRSLRKHQETIYSLGFVYSIGALMAFFIAMLFGAPFRVSTASLPTLLPRIFLEIILARLVMQAITKADRSETGFIACLPARC